MIRNGVKIVNGFYELVRVSKEVYIALQQPQEQLQG